MSARRTQLVLVAGAIALTGVLYLLPRKTSEEKAAIQTQTQASTYTFEGLLADAKSQVKRQELDPINQLEEKLQQAPQDTAVLGELGRSWDRLGFPAISSGYFRRIAEAAPGENTWINAAYRYFDAFKLSGDSTLQSMMVQQAIESYGKVLAINPDNLDAKTDLGICYAEGTTTPMQGIMLLREVVEKNPGHANAQFNLGILSVRSGQYDKALERFSKVLEIDPKRTLARFMIGRVYAQQGQKEKALTALEQVKKESSDPQLLKEADQLINQIQNNH